MCSEIDHLCYAGDRLLREDKVREAISKFEEVLRLDPTCCEAWTSLSLALLRDGQHEYCITACEKVLGSKDLDRWPKEQYCFMNMRILRSMFCLGRYEDLGIGVAELKKHINATELENKNRISRELELWGGAAAFYKAHLVQNPKQLPPKLPIYRNTSWSGYREYHPRGSGSAEPAIPFHQLYEIKGSLDLAFFYGGISDCRNFYAQLFHLAKHRKIRDENKARAREGDHIIFTLVEERPHVIARSLIIFFLLQEVAALSSRTSDPAYLHKEKIAILSTVWYIFAGDIMPQWAYIRMMTAIDTLKSGFVQFPWLTLDTANLQSVWKVFDEWYGPARDLHNVAYVQDHFSIVPDRDQLGILWDRTQEDTEEWELWFETKMIYPPSELLAEEEPRLYTILSSEDFPKNKIQLLKQYARENWKENVTLWDLAEEHHCPTKNGQSCFGSFDPSATLAKLLYLSDSILPAKLVPYKDSPRHINLSFHFFESIAIYLTEQPGIVVEIINAEVCDFMGGSRIYSKEQVHRKYDSIFLDDTPVLAACLYSAPLLKPEGYIQLTLPSTHWADDPNILAKNAGMESADKVRKLLGFTIINDKTPVERSRNERQLSSFRLKQVFPTKTESATIGRQLSAWIIDMFFKFAAPVPSLLERKEGHCPKRLPLTLNCWIQLLCYLVERLGYPNCWVADAVEEILSSRIDTPVITRIYTTREYPVRKGERDRRTYDVSHFVSTASFIPELRSLLTRQFNYLPFPIRIPLPTRSELHCYEMDLILMASEWQLYPTLALVFTKEIWMEYKPSILGKQPPPGPSYGVWIALQGAPSGTKDRIIIISNFDWDGDWVLNEAYDTKKKSSKARFWIEKAVHDRMVHEGWTASMMRTDWWTVASWKPVPVSTSRDLGSWESKMQDLK